VIGLSGELGSGKTTLVRSVAVGAGVPADQVSSPTFALIHTYAGPRFPIYHADLYRVSSRDELFSTGYFDLFDGAGAVLVEWIERIAGAAPVDWLELQLSFTDAQPRMLRATAHGVRGHALLAALAAD
jgi:tRNA threonylcarbamoyladenosine biosynthesis protein TsaE